jgi:hypothetical protein
MTPDSKTGMGYFSLLPLNFIIIIIIIITTTPPSPLPHPTSSWLYSSPCWASPVF